MLQQPRLGWVIASSIPLFEDKNCPYLWGSIVLFYQCFLRGNVVFGKINLFSLAFLLLQCNKQNLHTPTHRIRKPNIFPEMVKTASNVLSRSLDASGHHSAQIRKQNHSIGPICMSRVSEFIKMRICSILASWNIVFFILPVAQFPCVSPEVLFKEDMHIYMISVYTNQFWV